MNGLFKTKSSKDDRVLLPIKLTDEIVYLDEDKVDLSNYLIQHIQDLGVWHTQLGKYVKTAVVLSSNFCKRFAHVNY